MTIFHRRRLNSSVYTARDGDSLTRVATSGFLNSKKLQSSDEHSSPIEGRLFDLNSFNSSLAAAVVFFVSHQVHIVDIIIIAFFNYRII